MSKISQKELKNKLHYDPVSGIFTWIQSKKQAGHKCKIRGYIHIRINTHLYRAHRLAWLYMLGVFPKKGIDHKNQNTSDNSWDNLHLLSQENNLKNSFKNKRNTSGITGVFWDKNFQKWRAAINTDKKKIYLGASKDFFEACCLRKSAEYKYNYSPNHGRTRCHG